MKTIKKVVEENQDYRRLINAVVSRIGKESINDVNNHGINGGYSGFIYYSETHDFAMKHRKQIIALLTEQAESLGEEIISMVANFGVFRHSKMNNEDRMDLYKYIGGGKCEQGTITNLMAWFAAEEVCRMFDE